VEVKPLPPAVLAVAVPRFVDDIHLVAAVNERDVPDSEVLPAQFPNRGFGQRLLGLLDGFGC
jgi:hypothetical protein